jgi:hypothetical protein
MPEPPFDLEKGHRWFAVECNNRAWDLLEKAERSPAETDAMVHAAHAACLHWSHAGKEIHRLRALFLLASVYAELGNASACSAYADECLALANAKPEGCKDFDMAFALEGVARACALRGDLSAAIAHKEHAQQLAAAIENAEDRKIVEQSLASRNWHGVT